MAEKIHFTFGSQNRIIEAPNKCPLCHHIVIIKEFVSLLSHGNEFQIVFKCPNNDCESFFIAYYEKTVNNSQSFKFYKPTNIVFPKFPDIINTISPSFINIYKEAETANQLSLSQISGPAYRKAFEFLIKDYAKNISTTDKYSEIEKLFAGNVVKDFIPDARIQSVAKRALWLGNDETHYLRKWEEKDINDLVTLINLTIHWIEIEHLSSEYTKEMPE